MPNRFNDHGVDPAALAAAVFAAAVTSYSEEGPFVPFSLVIGITLLLIVCSYEFCRERSFWKNLAFGAVCALVSLLIYGFVREMWKAGWHLKTWIDAEGNLVRDTRVSPDELVIAWGILTAIFAFIGYLGSQKAKSKKDGKTAAQPELTGQHNS